MLKQLFLLIVNFLLQILHYIEKCFKYIMALCFCIYFIGKVLGIHLLYGGFSEYRT